MENENWGEDIISLMDEEGNQSEYKIVACAEMDGTEYMARPIWMPFWMRMSWTVWPRSSGIS